MRRGAEPRTFDDAMRIATKTGPNRSRRWLAALLLALAAIGPLHAAGFSVRDASTRLSDGVYRLDADLGFRFSEQAIQALQNGVPLTLRVDIEVARSRWWWLDATVATLEQRYRIKYHAFSDKYLVHNFNSGAFYTYPTLAGAVDALGRIRDLPLLDRKLVAEDEAYEVAIRVYLDIEALPSPLRPIAYITPAWHLTSEWTTWSLEP